MYTKHFRLKELPFRSSPDARFLYLSDHVNETLQKCSYIITHCIGALYVYGSYGTGKTTLAKRLKQQLADEPERYIIAYLVIPPYLTLNNLLRMIMEEFDIKTQNSYARCLKNMASWLLEQYQAGKKPVLILDEAQNLTPTHLKLLHFLLNYETSEEKLLQLVLFGQNQLSAKIERFPEMKSRMYPAALSPFNRDDTEELIAFRWMVAGGKEHPFSTDGIDQIFRISLGLPREIVKLCDLALLETYGKKRASVVVDDIAAAALNLDLQKE
jgi:general secretion pathway protein A